MHLAAPGCQTGTDAGSQSFPGTCRGLQQAAALPGASSSPPHYSMPTLQAPVVASGAAPEEGATARPRAPTLRDKWLQRQKENSGPTSDVVLTSNTVAYMQNDDRLYAVSHGQWRWCNRASSVCLPVVQWYD